METTINSNRNSNNSNRPAPVVFKSFANSGSDKPPQKLKLIHFAIEYIETGDPKNNYYLLTSYSDPAHPLKLYQSAVEKLNRQLEFAVTKAQELEAREEPLIDNEHYDCGIINSYGKMNVRLVLSTFHGQANIWVRLYTLDEENQNLPTRTAVRFCSKTIWTPLRHSLLQIN